MRAMLAAALAGQAPMLPAGALSYHAVTWGWLAGELILRATGATAGAIVRERLAGPLGLDLRIGVPADDPLRARVLRPRPAAGYRLTAFMAAEPDPRLALVYGNPGVPIDAWADADLCAIEAPAVNGIATARAMALLYGRARLRRHRVAPRRSRAALHPPAAAPTRSRAGRCATARPDTSSSGRRASSARSPMRLAIPARAAGRTARGRRGAPGSRSCRAICAPPMPTAGRPVCSRRCTRRCSHERRPPEHRARDGRPAGCGVSALLRPRGRACPAPGRARAVGHGLRERLLRLAAVCAVALGDAGRPARVGDRRLRQRRRARGLDADDRPSAARRRLRHGARRQDALRRPRPAARLRGSADE